MCTCFSPLVSCLGLLYSHFLCTPPLWVSLQWPLFLLQSLSVISLLWIQSTPRAYPLQSSRPPCVIHPPRVDHAVVVRVLYVCRTDYKAWKERSFTSVYTLNSNCRSLIPTHRRPLAPSMCIRSPLRVNCLLPLLQQRKDLKVWY